MWILQFPVMYLADRFNKRKVTSLTTSRKLWNTIGKYEWRKKNHLFIVSINYFFTFLTSLGMWGASLCVCLLGYLDDNMHAAVILYICAVTIGCCSNVGFNINHMDLTPNYAGILMGLSNGFASSGGFGAPLLAGVIVKDVVSLK